MRFNRMTINQGVEHIFNQLSHQEILYASDPARGEYRGFAALHDLMDANMLFALSRPVLHGGYI